MSHRTFERDRPGSSSPALLTNRSDDMAMHDHRQTGGRLNISTSGDIAVAHQPGCSLSRRVGSVRGRIRIRAVASEQSLQLGGSLLA